VSAQPARREFYDDNVTERAKATRAPLQLIYELLIGASIVLIVVAALGDAAAALGLIDPIPATPVLLAAGGFLALIPALLTLRSAPESSSMRR
jgi:hypothetical protein